MAQRYAFGPIGRAFADQNLREERASGRCLAFSRAEDDFELKIPRQSSWADVQGAFPPGWQPDFIALYLSYTSIPAFLWTAPVPLIGIAADWNLLWHWYRRCLPRCDLVLTDAGGVHALAREGIRQARPANLFGCGRDYLDEAWTPGPRDIDVFFVGNFHPAVQRERLPWLGRIAQLGYRWRVELRTGVFGAEYRQLLGRSRIVFNRSIRGEANRRVFEAVAAGALLFQEEGNREVSQFLREGEEYVVS